MEQRISLRHSEYEPGWACYIYQGRLFPSKTGDLLFSDFFQESLIIESMIRITKCPSCGSTKIKRVSGDWHDERDGVAYVVPDLEYYECPEWGERVYDGSAMRKREQNSPAFRRMQTR